MQERNSALSGLSSAFIQFPIIIALYNLVINPMRFSLQFSATAIRQINSIVTSFTGVEYDTTRNTIALMDGMGKVISEHGADVFRNVEDGRQRISAVLRIFPTSPISAAR